LDVGVERLLDLRQLLQTSGFDRSPVVPHVPAPG
jgi:hypothetical protein